MMKIPPHLRPPLPLENGDHLKSDEFLRRYDAMPDLEAIGDYLEQSLAELRKAARKKSASAASSNGSKKGTPGRASKTSQAPAPKKG